MFGKMRDLLSREISHLKTGSVTTMTTLLSFVPLLHSLHHLVKLVALSIIAFS